MKSVISKLRYDPIVEAKANASARMSQNIKAKMYVSIQIHIIQKTSEIKEKIRDDADGILEKNTTIYNI